ncbi:unnamed protein product [Chironomus riparius]|uniref:C-type lectin domain-containing protein n=1 Tax=Chironomus riparius TaxID=315576 RepID=A0A9N9WWR2_9DIPT|nr:unnamed protein product [Chironomus riparius]
MISKLFLLAATSQLVSSLSHGSYGDHESSSNLHTFFPSYDAAFAEIGRYYGQVNDWKYRKVYFISKYFKSSWAEAKAICRSFDLELATFENLVEFTNFQKILKAANPFPPNIDMVHVDGMTPNTGSTTDWYWTNSGVKIPYTLQWNPGQPDNAGGQEACLTIRKYGGDYAFNDYFCSERTTYFICQKTELFHEEI